MTKKTAEPRDVSAAEEAANAKVARMSDADVLRISGNGTYGPGLMGDSIEIGRAIHARAQKILAETGGGVFGPALTDPDYAKKQAAKREAAAEPEPEESEPADERTGDIDPADLKDPRNPWTYVTLGGAKILAQKGGVSYAPKVKRAELIEALQAAGIEPPAVPDDPSEEDGED